LSISDAERDRVRIGHMLDAVEGIVDMVGTATLQDIFSDWMRARAMERGFEIISEASRHVSDRLKETEPDIPWRQIRDFGNVLRHDYDGVELALLFRGVFDDLPALEAALRRMLTRLPG
jgi:uncharacterized protein with HEPN domain